MKVLILDDEKLVADLISDYLSKVDFVSEVLQTNDYHTINSYISSNSIDLLFLDLYMPNFVGLDVLESIRNSEIDVKVIVLSSHFQAKNINRALELGANGYLSKSINKAEIIKAIEHIRQGTIYLCSECYKELNLQQLNLINPRFNFKDLLTKREIDILKEIVEGLSSQAMADKLFISKETVETHKKHLFEKFGVNKSTQLVKLAVENGVI
jgi:DNA-binding NarL/FixJ family response regulator